MLWVSVDNGFCPITSVLVNRTEPRDRHKTKVGIYFEEAKRVFCCGFFNCFTSFC